MQVFLTHLHSDHHADLATLYVGAMFGRKQPWEVWGPSGEAPEFGTAAAIEGLRQVRYGSLWFEALDCLRHCKLCDSVEVSLFQEIKIS